MHVGIESGVALSNKASRIRRDVRTRQEVSVTDGYFGSEKPALGEGAFKRDAA